jgi:hypothetical protein
MNIYWNKYENIFICIYSIMEFRVLGMNFNLKVVVICVVLGMFLGCNLLCSCSKESFSDIKASMSEGVPSAPSAWKISDYPKVDKDSDLSWRHLAPEAQMSKMVEPDQLAFLADTAFAPQCCPASYSNGSGCACLNGEQIKFLNERGGNRTLNSEF